MMTNDVGRLRELVAQVSELSKKLKLINSCIMSYRWYNFLDITKWIFFSFSMVDPLKWKVKPIKREEKLKNKIMKKV